MERTWHFFVGHFDNPWERLFSGQGVQFEDLEITDEIEKDPDIVTTILLVYNLQFFFLDFLESEVSPNR